MPYELKTFFRPEDDNEFHRYIQIGMESETGDFTGVIIDYAGGGVYGNFYFIDGTCLNYSEETAELDDDQMERELEKAYPGIIGRLYDVFDRYARWNGDICIYEFTQRFIEEFGPFSKEDVVLIAEGGLTPICVANTYFEGWKTVVPEDLSGQDADSYECPEHGKQKIAFVCRHLETGSDLGFVEGAPDPFADAPIKEAWCLECENVREQQGGWGPAAQEHASIRAVCDQCYEEIKKSNS